MELLGTTGKRIRVLRFDFGMTQTELARRVSTSRTHITSIEADAVPRVSGVLIARIAQALGSTPGYLLLTTDDPLPCPDSLHDEIPPNIAKFIARLDEFPPQLTAPIIAHLHSQIDLLLNAANHLSNPGHPAPAVNSYDRHRHNSPDE